ncbi:MAG TPA: GNAT family N-acetyltransferase [Verrucomicrobiales bacterium]|nr:GNAT family N-acetyltransferase [Verrucomicrobiales bacterium]
MSTVTPASPSGSKGLRYRDYTPADEAAAYEVCLRTGDAGKDATALYRDPRALGNIYVGAYLAFEPGLSLLLEDESGVCGYCLGALDTPAFFRRFATEWLPPLRLRHPEPTGDPAAWSLDERLYHELHHPDLTHPEPIETYPSHMHIDLLPRAQGQGWGKRLVGELLDRMKHRGSAGVHLGMWARNERAYHFYRAFGFEELCRVGEGDRASIYLGLRFR